MSLRQFINQILAYIFQWQRKGINLLVPKYATLEKNPETCRFFIFKQAYREIIFLFLRSSM